MDFVKECLLQMVERYWHAEGQKAEKDYQSLILLEESSIFLKYFKGRHLPSFFFAVLADNNLNSI